MQSEKKVMLEGQKIISTSTDTRLFFRWNWHFSNTWHTFFRACKKITHSVVIRQKKIFQMGVYFKMRIKISTDVKVQFKFFHFFAVLYSPGLELSHWHPCVRKTWQGFFSLQMVLIIGDKILITAYINYSKFSRSHGRKTDVGVFVMTRSIIDNDASM